MEISPTLGISNQYNPGPMEQYASIASQGLQQLGAQVQQDITTIQTNQQLRSFSQQLQGVNPAKVTNPDGSFDPTFASQMTQAITSNPLAAHSPVGMQAINELGQAHQAAIQSTLLGQRLNNQYGIASMRTGAQEDIAQGHDATRVATNAASNTTRSNIAAGNQDLGYYKTDQGNATKYGLQANQFYNQGALQAEREQAASDLQQRALDHRSSMEDQKRQDKNSTVPVQAYSLQQKAWEDYENRNAEFQDANARLDPSNKDSVAKYAGTSTALNNAKEQYDKASGIVASYRGGKAAQPGTPQAPAIDGLGMPSGPSPAQPNALVPSDVIGPDSGTPAQSKSIDKTTAASFLKQAGGDKARARLLAQQAGYTF